MIETHILSTSPHLILHRISGDISESESASGTESGYSKIIDSVKICGLFDLILDMRTYHFDTLNARRIWSLGFKTAPLLAASVRNVAIVGDDNATVRAEKDMLENDRVKFFWSYEDAYQWIGGMNE